MKVKYLKVFTMIALCLVVFSNVNAQSAVNGDKESARAFVQKFYDWYAAVYDRPPNPKEPSSVTIAVTKKKDVFGAVLYKTLVNYLNTPPVEEMDGLDSDPFLSGQDIGRGYQAGNIRQVGNKFFIDIHNIEKGKPVKAILAAEILVVPEVEKVNGKWVFTNFVFPVDGKRYDLLVMLNNIQKQRNLKRGHKA